MTTQLTQLSIWSTARAGIIQVLVLLLALTVCACSFSNKAPQTEAEFENAYLKALPQLDKAKGAKLDSAWKQVIQYYAGLHRFRSEKQDFEWSNYATWDNRKPGTPTLVEHFAGLKPAQGHIWVGIGMHEDQTAQAYHIWGNGQQYTVSRVVPHTVLQYMPSHAQQAHPLFARHKQASLALIAIPDTLGVFSVTYGEDSVLWQPNLVNWQTSAVAASRHGAMKIFNLREFLRNTTSKPQWASSAEEEAIKLGLPQKRKSAYSNLPSNPDSITFQLLAKSLISSNEDVVLGALQKLDWKGLPAEYKPLYYATLDRNPSDTIINFITSITYRRRDTAAIPALERAFERKGFHRGILQALYLLKDYEFLAKHSAVILDSLQAEFMATLPTIDPKWGHAKSTAGMNKRLLLSIYFRYTTQAWLNQHYPTRKVVVAHNCYFMPYWPSYAHLEPLSTGNTVRTIVDFGEDDVLALSQSGLLGTMHKRDLLHTSTSRPQALHTLHSLWQSGQHKALLRAVKEFKAQHGTPNATEIPFSPPLFALYASLDQHYDNPTWEYGSYHDIDSICPTDVDNDGIAEVFLTRDWNAADVSFHDLEVYRQDSGQYKKWATHTINSYDDMGMGNGERGYWVFHDFENDGLKELVVFRYHIRNRRSTPLTAEVPYYAYRYTPNGYVLVSPQAFPEAHDFALEYLAQHPTLQHWVTQGKKWQ